MICLSCGQRNRRDAIFCGACGSGLSGPANPSAVASYGGGSGSPFVGRRWEMEQLVRCVEEVLAGRWRVVMLVGEPGIGKTRTAQQLSNYAQSVGMGVHWGRCYEGEGAPPYWTWVQPLRSYIQRLQRSDSSQLAAQLGPGAADIAEIIPEVLDALPSLGPPPALAPERARFRFFGSITAFLKQAAQYQPMMLVLDDLHWADKSSLLLLQFLVNQFQGGPLLVLGCYREVELSRQLPLAETLPQISREPCFRRELLEGLSLEDTGRFIEATVGARPSEGMVAAVHSRTEGNPFFTVEVVRLLSQQGLLMEDGDNGPLSIGLPPGVSEVIGQRLDTLSRQCRGTLNTAAVIGREFDFKLLMALSDGGSEDKLLEVIDEALASRLVEALPTRLEGYQFSHALVQQTLVEELSTSRRVRLHARIGETLEDLYRDNLEAHAAELAYHFVGAQPVLGSEKLVTYSLLAGEQALGAYAHEEALVHFERALEAKKGQPMDLETGKLLAGLGRAQGSTGQVREAWSTLGHAFDYFAATGEVTQAVAVAEHPLLFVSGLPMEATQLAERALTLVSPESHEAGRLWSRFGLLLNLEKGDYGRSQDAFDRAMSIARRENDLALEMRTLANSADADWYQIRHRQVLEKSLRAIELARRANDPRTEIFSRFLAVYEFTAMGNAAGASEHALDMLTQAERARDRDFLAMSYLANLFLCRHKGDWLSAREFSERGLAAESRATWIVGFRSVLEHQLGNYAAGEMYLDRLLADMKGAAPGPNPEYIAPACLLPMIARITGETDRLDLAKNAAESVLVSPSVTPLYAMWARFGLAMVSAQQNDFATAARQYAALKPVVQGVMLPGYIAGDRLLGLLSRTVGAIDQAVEHFEEALDFCRDAGYLPDLAWSCHDYAEALLSGVNGPGIPPDIRKKAMALLGQALAQSRELGMAPLMERVVALQRGITPQSDRAPAYPDGLTRREVEILGLIAGGKSNREIAEDLVLSIRTVERHVANIYGKTNAHGRASATSYALLHNLASGI